MSERFVLPKHPTLDDFFGKLETPKGNVAANQILNQFASVADLLQNTTRSPHGTVVHLPDTQTITFVNLPRHEFALGVTEIAEVNHFRLV